MRALLLALLGGLLLVGCTMSTSQACGPSTCLGCCDSTGFCQTGTAPSACGWAGGLCAGCAGGLTCTAGLCSSPGTGGAGGGTGGGSAQVAGCLLPSGVVLPVASETALHCGRPGAACTACPAGQQCPTSGAQAGTCVSSGSGGGAGGGSGVGGAGGGSAQTLDRAACTGWSTGTVQQSGVTLTLQGAKASVLSSGALNVAMTARPAGAILNGDSVVVLQFAPRPGQSSYSPNGAVLMGLLRYNNAWQTVDASNMCELTLGANQLASTVGTCDGEVSGVARCLFTGNAQVVVGFDVPVNVAASQIHIPCGGSGDSCSANSDCCSQSCSPVGLGCY